MKTLFVAMLVIAFVFALTTATRPLGKVVIVIQCDMPFEHAGVHCWSAGGDVGYYSLTGGENIRFTFRNYLVNYYFCDFQTPHGSGAYGVFTKRIDSLCNGYCVWHLTKTKGLCLAKEDGGTYCQDWKIPPRRPPPPYVGSGIKNITSP